MPTADAGIPQFAGQDGSQPDLKFAEHVLGGTSATTSGYR